MDGGFLYALAMQAIAVNAAGGDSTNFLDWNICGLSVASGSTSV
jgi:hypothetical protein